MWDPLLAELGNMPAPARHELRGFGGTPLPPDGSFSHAEDLAAALERPAVLDTFFEEEERLLEAGDVDGATELNVAFWVGAADQSVQQAVREMQRRAFELQLSSQAEAVVADWNDLAAVRAPALVVTGDRDIEDFQRMAERLLTELPDARAGTIEGAGHLPALERPRETAALLEDFLEDLAGGV